MSRRKRNSTRPDQSYPGYKGTFTTKCVPIDKKTGKYGCRVFVDGRVVAQQVAPSKSKVGETLREMLRMIDKTGWQSPMAHASRHRAWRKSQKK